MRRLPIIGGICALLVIIAGCAGIPTGGNPTSAPTDTPTVSPSDTSTSTNKHCRKTDRRPHPDPPQTFTQETALTFVEEYIEVTIYNIIVNQYDEPTYDRIDVFTEGFIVNSTDTGYVVHIRHAATAYFCDGGHGDAMGNVIDLFLNESVLVMNGSSVYGTHTSDPDEHDKVSVEMIFDNGTVLHRWNEG